MNDTTRKYLIDRYFEILKELIATGEYIGRSHILSEEAKFIHNKAVEFINNSSCGC